MFREEKERQSHNTVEFYERTQHHPCGSPEVFFALYAIKSEKQDGGNGNVELHHENGGQQFVSTEQNDESLLRVRESGATHSHIQPPSEKYHPQQQPYEGGRQSKRCYKERKERTVVIGVAIFCRIGRIQRQSLQGMPKGAPENQKVVAVMPKRFRITVTKQLAECACHCQKQP